MKYTHLTKILLILTLLFSTIQSYSQARGGIGIGLGYNLPLSNNDYNIGGGGFIQGSIALNNKWAIVPRLGVENLDGNGRAVYDQYGYVSRHINNLGLIYIGVSAKYFFRQHFFAEAGPTLFVGAGGDGVDAGGISASGAAGYNLKLDRHSSLEFSLNTSVIYIDSSNGTVPIVSAKLAYAFNFKGKD